METVFLNQYSIEKNNFYLRRVYSFLELLEDEYPNFKEWYFNTLVTNNKFLDDRSIILKIYKNEICAVSIIKHSEDKICTFRVTERFQGLSIGTDLMKETIRVIGNNKPLITVSEDRINQFKSLLQKFDFKLHATYQDYYKFNKIEYSFNKPIEGIEEEIYIPELIY
ncbi:hypothetical protein [Empedobacter tilapiae]